MIRAEEIPEFFTPIGPTAMGGAFTAIANDENAIWTNPAGVGRVRKARSRSAFHLAKFPNAIVGANTSGRTFYNSLQSSGADNVSNVVENSSNVADKPFYARAAVFPVTMFDLGKQKPAAFGLFLNSKTHGLITQDDPERTAISSTTDVGGVITLGSTNFANRANFGINVRPVYRYAFEDKIDTAILLDKKQVSDLIKNKSNKSFGLGLDAGVMYTMADFWFPTIGLAVLNLPTGCKQDYLNPFSEKREVVCGTKYSGSFSNPEALSTIDPMDARVGFSISPRVSKSLTMRLGLDVHHIYVTDGKSSYGLSNIEPIRTLHGGVEIFAGHPLKELPPFIVRFGASQGFFTSGVTIRMPYFTLEFATYGVDVSSTKKPQEDRRMLASISFDF